MEFSMIESMQKAFEGGGIWMWPILVCLVLTLAIVFERAYFLYVKSAEDKAGLLKGLNSHVLRGDINGGIRFLNSQKQGPISRILKAGLLRAHRDDAEVQASLDEASLREIPLLENRIGYLAVLSNGATLLGLLGTIEGMIKCFEAVAKVDPAQKATILSGGISEAMNCTAFGLIVAIPALFFFAWLNTKVQHTIDDINEGIVTEMNLVLANRRLFSSQVEGAGEGAGAQAK
jgi:biopolymer transport protein ExbB/TolQ